MSVCDFVVGAAAQLGEAVHAEVEQLRRLHAGPPAHVALDEARNGHYIRGFGIPAYPAEKLTLVRGDKGEAVGKLQELLNACGYALDVDNSFGPATQGAWSEYLAAYILKALK